MQRLRPGCFGVPGKGEAAAQNWRKLRNGQHHNLNTSHWGNQIKDNLMMGKSSTYRTGDYIYIYVYKTPNPKT
jgi:hypothetical protein